MYVFHKSAHKTSRSDLDFDSDFVCRGRAMTKKEGKLVQTGSGNGGSVPHSVNQSVQVEIQI